MVVELSGRDGLKTNALNKRTVDDTINIRQRHNKGLRLAHLTESILKGRTARLAAEEHLEKKKKKKKKWDRRSAIVISAPQCTISV